MISQRLSYTIIFFILVIVLIIVSKPRFLFDEKGDLISFGTGENNTTIMPLGIVVVLLAFASFYMFAIIDIIFEKK